MGGSAVHEVFTLSLVELTQRIHRKDLSPVELMEVVLARIEATRGTLNAVTVGRDPELCMLDARRSEERIARGEGGALEGIPLGVKDLEDVREMPTSMGSKLFEGKVAERDSTQVARLKAAGAIVVAKTNTPEFGFTAISKNLPFGTTSSPWDPERTPGGSSGGSAAVLAGGVIPLVTASDGGGSIRIPASFTGAYGLKPSYGRVPRDPLSAWDYGATAVYGPLTRTVEDAALVLDQVVGTSLGDPASLPHPEFSYLDLVRQPFDRRLHIAFAPDLGVGVVQSDVARVVEEAVGAFEALGHDVKRIEGGPPALGEAWGSLGNFEIAAQLHEALEERPDDITRAFARGLKTAWDMTPERWGAAARARARVVEWTAEVFERFDLLLTPTVPYDPPPAGGPFPKETEGRVQPPAGVAVFTIPFNLSWHPAASVRAGLSDVGLPVGLQIVGPRHREDLVLQASMAFERSKPWHPDWPV